MRTFRQIVTNRHCGHRQNLRRRDPALFSNVEFTISTGTLEVDKSASNRKTTVVELSTGLASPPFDSCICPNLRCQDK